MNFLVNSIFQVEILKLEKLTVDVLQNAIKKFNTNEDMLPAKFNYHQIMPMKYGILATDF